MLCGSVGLFSLASNCCSQTNVFFSLSMKLKMFLGSKLRPLDPTMHFSTNDHNVLFHLTLQPLKLLVGTSGLFENCAFKGRFFAFNARLLSPVLKANSSLAIY